ncbi:MAG: type II toxin-antitoxin system VapC family toxin [Myxococcota bacterium]
MLDTNICIHLLNGTSSNARTALHETHSDEVCVSAITASELAFGARKSRKRATKRSVEVFLTEMPIAAYGADAIMHYAAARATLAKRGVSIGPLDTLIAAHALSLEATLVTDNVREFKRVPGLQLENWHRP